MHRRDLLLTGCAALATAPLVPLRLASADQSGSETAASGAGGASADGKLAEWISLFDGHTLQGWQAIARANPAQRARWHALQQPGATRRPDDAQLEATMRHTGRWTVEEGAIVGAQQPAGSGLGAYLISEATFGDFELEIDARPDWPIDTGIMVRCADIANVGFQVLVDHRPNGCIGGVYGNSIGAFRAYPFVIDAEVDRSASGPWQPTRMRAGTQPDGVVTPPRYAAPVEAFLDAWKPGDWNRFRVRCVGLLPTITIWINDVKMSEFDAESYRALGYDPKAVARLLGPQGHVALEVHSNDPRVGNERWWPGAVCRWKRIRARRLA